jgi:hypothetical protein
VRTQPSEGGYIHVPQVGTKVERGNCKKARKEALLFEKKSKDFWSLGIA